MMFLYSAQWNSELSKLGLSLAYIINEMIMHRILNVFKCIIFARSHRYKVYYLIMKKVKITFKS